jgi:hypothetical protein
MNSSIENRLQGEGTCQIVRTHSSSEGVLKAIKGKDGARNPGLTQGKLALVLGVTSTTVGNWKDKGEFKQKGWKYRFQDKRYYPIDEVCAIARVVL